MLLIFKNRKGLILLQVIVIVAVLAFLVVAILKFLLGRHATVSRAKRTIDSKSIIEACMVEKNIEWENNVPSDGECLIDVEGTPDTGDDITVRVDVQGNSPPYQITYSVDMDDVRGY
jgi:hypothetical protein